MFLKIAIIQYDIIWEDIEANLSLLSQIITEIERDTDLIILPEMFATGFSMNTERIAQEEDGSVVNWLKESAAKMNVAIMGTQAIKDSDGVYNRALFVTPDKQLSFYNKRHLFSPGEENISYLQGKQRVVFELKGVRILPQICYDLRFPVFSRNINDYDMAIYMANWPANRRNVWNTLLKARAIENQCYVVGVNRVGEGGGIDYSGDSQFVDFKGHLIQEAKSKKQFIISANIDLKQLNLFRVKFPVYKDTDDFNLILK